MKTSWIAALGIAAVALTSATALAEPPCEGPYEQTEWAGPGASRPRSYEHGYERGYGDREYARDRDYARIERWERYRRWEHMRRMRMRDHYRW